MTDRRVFHMRLPVATFLLIGGVSVLGFGDPAAAQTAVGDSAYVFRHSYGDDSPTRALIRAPSASAGLSIEPGARARGPGSRANPPNTDGVSAGPVACALGSVCSVESANASGSGAGASPEIAVKRTDPTGIVFAEHAGAYWSVGPQLARLREYMLEHDQAGPMFVRFLTDPVKVPAMSLRMQIGFVTEDEHRPQPPYRRGEREAELVAWMTVDSRTARSARCLSALHQWIEGHGFQPVGPVTEIYSVDLSGREVEDRVELQVAIEPAKPEPSKPPANAAVTGSAPAPPFEIKVVEGDSVIGSVPRGWQAAADESARQRAAEGSAKTPVEPKENLVEHPPATTETARIDPRTDTTRADIEQPGEAEPDAAVGAKVPSARASTRTGSISQLLEHRRFDQIAEQILPPADTIPPSLQIWLGQVVYRLSALAEGIKRVHPGEGETIFAVIEATNRRYAAVFVGSSVDPLEPPVVYVDSESDPLAAEKRAIMLQLDLLLGRVALRSVDVTATLSELVGILQRIADLVRKSRV